MEGMKEATEGAAQTVLDSVAADAAAFPIFMGLVALVVAAVVVWFTVEMAKVTAVSKLKRKPKKGSSDETFVGVIAKQFHWYPLAIWLINLVFGSGSGIGVGAIDGFEEGNLGWWGIPFGLVGGLLSKVLAQYCKKFSDAASELFLGRLKRLIGRLFGGDKAEG